MMMTFPTLGGTVEPGNPVMDYLANRLDFTAELILESGYASVRAGAREEIANIADLLREIGRMP